MFVVSWWLSVWVPHVRLWLCERGSSVHVGSLVRVCGTLGALGVACVGLGRAGVCLGGLLFLDGVESVCLPSIVSLSVLLRLCGWVSVCDWGWCVFVSVWH